jgi:hypothetical protein
VAGLLSELPSTSDYGQMFPSEQLVQVQHEQSLQLESRIVGGATHVFCGVYGSVVVAGGGAFKVDALTKTGIAAPVERRNSRWPRTGDALVKYLTTQALNSKHTTKQTPNLTRMRGDGDISTIVVADDIVKHSF